MCSSANLLALNAFVDRVSRSALQAEVRLSRCGWTKRSPPARLDPVTPSETLPSSSSRLPLLLKPRGAQLLPAVLASSSSLRRWSRCGELISFSSTPFGRLGEPDRSTIGEEPGDSTRHGSLRSDSSVCGGVAIEVCSRETGVWSVGTGLVSWRSWSLCCKLNAF